MGGGIRPIPITGKSRNSANLDATAAEDVSAAIGSSYLGIFPARPRYVRPMASREDEEKVSRGAAEQLVAGLFHQARSAAKKRRRPIPRADRLAEAVLKRARSKEP